MKKKHILLAEDESHARNTLALIFRKAGYKVTTAVDGRETLEDLLNANYRRQPVDLLVTDINMPGLNGLQLIEQVRQNQMRFPILVITGYGSKDMLIQLMRMGCNDFIEKPFEAEQVLESVETVLKRHETQDDAMPRQPAVRERDIAPIDVSGAHVPIAYHFKPLSRSGGVIFDFRNTPSGVIIFMADAVKFQAGIELRSFFFDALDQGGKDSVGDNVAGKLPQALRMHEIKEGKLGPRVSVAYLSIDPDKLHVDAAFSGPPPLLRIMTDKNAYSIHGYHLNEKNGIMGIFAAAGYETRRFPVKCGDRVLLYSAGIRSLLSSDGPPAETNGPGPARGNLIQLVHRYVNMDLKGMMGGLWEAVNKSRDRWPPDDLLLLGLEIPCNEIKGTVD